MLTGWGERRPFHLITERLDAIGLQRRPGDPPLRGAASNTPSDSSSL
jgi:hypothetical protein